MELPYRSLTLAPTLPLMMGLRLSSLAVLEGEFGFIVLGAAAEVSAAAAPCWDGAAPTPTNGDPPADDPSGSVGIVLAALVTRAGPRYVDDRLGSAADAMEF